MFSRLSLTGDPRVPKDSCIDIVPAIAPTRELLANEAISLETLLFQTLPSATYQGLFAQIKRRLMDLQIARLTETLDEHDPPIAVVHFPDGSIEVQRMQMAPHSSGQNAPTMPTQQELLNMVYPAHEYGVDTETIDSQDEEGNEEPPSESKE